MKADEHKFVWTVYTIIDKLFAANPDQNGKHGFMYLGEEFQEYSFL